MKRENELSLWEDEDMDLLSPIRNAIFGVPTFRHEEKNFNKLMKTDIKETENSYELEMEMPGVDKKDVNIDLKNGYLTVSTEKHSSNDEKDKKGNYIRRERYFGSTSRSFYVGDKIKEEDVSASLEHGLLTILVPKKAPQEIEHKKIEIK